MHLIFIDLETNGLNPNTDNILEIGAILAEFDPKTFELTILDTFQSLIQPRQNLSPASGRITGISESELALAPKLFQVQEKWFDWLESKLEPKSTVILVGHSIVDFDLRFLKFEGWFLPDNYKIIDTLPLTKILLPQSQAVNLEFLCKSLQLTEQINKRAENLNLEIKAHRALFDCLCGYELLHKCLNLLEEYHLPAPVIQNLGRYYLPFDLNKLLISLREASLEHKNQDFERGTKLNWLLEPHKPNFISQILSLPLNSSLELLSQASSDFTVGMRQVLLQLITIQSLNKYYARESLNFHGRDIDYAWLQLVLKYLQPILTSPNTATTLPLLEELLWQIGEVSEKKLKLFEVIVILEELGQGSYHLEPFLQNAIQKVLASYDFLLLNLQSFWQFNQFFYNPTRMTLIEDVIFRKFASFCVNLQELAEVLKGESSQFVQSRFCDFLQIELREILNNFGKLDSNSIYRFNLIKDYIQISVVKEGFELGKYLENVLESNSNLVIPTFGETEEIQIWLELFGCNSPQVRNRVLPNIQTSNDSTLYLDEPKINELIIEITNQERNKPTLILCGDNRTLKAVEKNCFDNLRPEQYLILGESGSKTKIISKIGNNFQGIVVLKQSDLGYLLNFVGRIWFSKIFFINKPHLVVNDYWKLKWANQYQQNFKTATNLYLKTRIRRAAVLILQ